MNPIKKAAVSATALTKVEHGELYQIKRHGAIKKRRADIPKAYQRIYDKAVKGKSLRAAAKSFCLECMGWQRDEVRQCTAMACPLFPYRPYSDKMAQEFLPSAKNRDFRGIESTNSREVVISAGETCE